MTLVETASFPVKKASRPYNIIQGPKPLKSLTKHVGKFRDAVKVTFMILGGKTQRLSGSIHSSGYVLC